MKIVEFIQSVEVQDEDGKIRTTWKIGDRLHALRKTVNGYQTTHGHFLFDEVKEITQNVK